jgi:hypothetical protein
LKFKPVEEEMQIKSIQVETGKKKLEHARAEIQTLSHKV